MAKKSRAEKFAEREREAQLAAAKAASKHMSKYALKKLARLKEEEEAEAEYQAELEASSSDSSSSDTTVSTESSSTSSSSASTAASTSSSNATSSSSSSSSSSEGSTDSTSTAQKPLKPSGRRVFQVQPLRYTPKSNNKENSTAEVIEATKARGYVPRSQYSRYTYKTRSRIAERIAQVVREGTAGVEDFVKRKLESGAEAIEVVRNGKVVTVFRHANEGELPQKVIEHRAKRAERIMAIREARLQARVRFIEEGKSLPKFRIRKGKVVLKVPKKASFQREKISSMGIETTGRLPNIYSLEERSAMLAPHNRRKNLLFTPIRRHNAPNKGFDFVSKFLTAWSKRMDKEGIFNEFFDHVRHVRSEENGIAYVGLPAFLKFLEGKRKTEIINDYGFDYSLFIKRTEVTSFIATMKPLALEWMAKRHPLEKSYALVYLDTYPLKIKLGHQRIITLQQLFALGVTLDGRKDLIGIIPDITQGRITIDFWEHVLAHWKGLGCENICYLVASARLRYLDRALTSYYPETSLHYNLHDLLRYDSYGLPEEVRKEFMEEAFLMLDAEDFDSAKPMLDALRAKWEPKMTDGQYILSGYVDTLKRYTLLPPQERNIFQSQKLISQAASLLVGAKDSNDFFSDCGEMLNYLFYRYLLIAKPYWIEHQDAAINNLAFSKLFTKLRHADDSGSKLLDRLLSEQHQDFMYRHFGKFGNGPVFNLNPNKKRISLSGQIEDNAAIMGDDLKDKSNAALNTAPNLGSLNHHSDSEDNLRNQGDNIALHRGSSPAQATGFGLADVVSSALSTDFNLEETAQAVKKEQEELGLGHASVDLNGFNGNENDFEDVAVAHVDFVSDDKVSDEANSSYDPLREGPDFAASLTDTDSADLDSSKAAPTERHKSKRDLIKEANARAEDERLTQSQAAAIAEDSAAAQALAKMAVFEKNLMGMTDNSINERLPAFLLETPQSLTLLATTQNLIEPALSYQGFTSGLDQYSDATQVSTMGMDDYTSKGGASSADNGAGNASANGTANGEAANNAQGNQDANGNAQGNAQGNAALNLDDKVIKMGSDESSESDGAAANAAPREGAALVSEDTAKASMVNERRAYALYGEMQPQVRMTTQINGEDWDFTKELANHQEVSDIFGVERLTEAARALLAEVDGTFGFKVTKPKHTKARAQRKAVQKAARAAKAALEAKKNAQNPNSTSLAGSLNVNGAPDVAGATITLDNTQGVDAEQIAAQSSKAQGKKAKAKKGKLSAQEQAALAAQSSALADYEDADNFDDLDDFEEEILVTESVAAHDMADEQSDGANGDNDAEALGQGEGFTLSDSQEALAFSKAQAKNNVDDALDELIKAHKDTKSKVDLSSVAKESLSLGSTMAPLGFATPLALSQGFDPSLDDALTSLDSNAALLANTIRVIDDASVINDPSKVATKEEDSSKASAKANEDKASASAAKKSKGKKQAKAAADVLDDEVVIELESVASSTIKAQDQAPVVGQGSYAQYQDGQEQYGEAAVLGADAGVLAPVSSKAKRSKKAAAKAAEAAKLAQEAEQAAAEAKAEQAAAQIAEDAALDSAKAVEADANKAVDAADSSAKAQDESSAKASKDAAAESNKAVEADAALAEDGAADASDKSQDAEAATDANAEDGAANDGAKASEDSSDAAKVSEADADSSKDVEAQTDAEDSDEADDASDEAKGSKAEIRDPSVPAIIAEACYAKRYKEVPDNLFTMVESVGSGSLVRKYQIGDISGLEGMDASSGFSIVDKSVSNVDLIAEVSSNIQSANAVLGMLRPNIAQALREDRMLLRQSERELVAQLLGPDFAKTDMDNVFHQVTPIFRSLVQSRLNKLADSEDYRQKLIRQKKHKKDHERYLKRQAAKQALLASTLQTAPAATAEQVLDRNGVAIGTKSLDDLSIVQGASTLNPDDLIPIQSIKEDPSAQVKIMATEDDLKKLESLKAIEDSFDVKPMAKTKFNSTATTDPSLKLQVENQSHIVVTPQVMSKLLSEESQEQEQDELTLELNTAAANNELTAANATSGSIAPAQDTPIPTSVAKPTVGGDAKVKGKGKKKKAKSEQEQQQKQGDSTAQEQNASKANNQQQHAKHPPKKAKKGILDSNKTQKIEMPRSDEAEGSLEVMKPSEAKVQVVPESMRNQIFKRYNRPLGIRTQSPAKVRYFYQQRQKKRLAKQAQGRKR